MKTNIRQFTRYLYAGLAAGVLAVAMLPVLVQNVSAAQVTTRSIEMSSATASAAGTSYNVTFTPGTSGTIQGIVVDICDNDPINGDTSCTFPAGFDWGGATPTLVPGYTGMGTGWSAAGVQAGAGSGKSQVLELSATTAQAVSTSTAMNFVISSATNPSTTNHSFYARIVTFNTSLNMTTNYTTSGTTRAGSFGGMVDYGGIALSTTNAISISAAVMETLTFCVSPTDLTSSTCASATPGGVALTLGRGTPVTLSTGFVDTASVYTQISTNASTGAIVRMKAGNSCTGASGGGLSSNGGSTCAISGLNNTSAAAMTAGSATFGLYVATGALSSGGSGASAADANYHSGSHTTIASDLWYGMDNSNVTSTYGDPIFSTSGAPCSLVNNQLVFAATASLTTPAGVYTGSESLIATGTF